MNNKIILANWGLQTPMGYELIHEYLPQEDCNGKSILLISMLSDKENERLVKACQALGFSEGNIVLYKEGVPSQKTRQYDTIYVGEGNTFEMLHFIRENNLVQNIIDWFVQGARYIGISAGAHIAGADIEAVCSFDENNVGLEDLNGLCLYDGIVIPHIDVDQVRRFEAYKKAVESGKYAYIVSLADGDIEVMSVDLIHEIHIRAFEIAIENLRKMMDKICSRPEDRPEYLSIETSTGEIVDVEVLTMVEIDNENYALYLLESKKGLYDIYAARLYRNENGDDCYEGLNNEEVRVKLHDFVQKLIKKKGWRYYDDICDR